jgi:hypothetical protein
VAPVAPADHPIWAGPNCEGVLALGRDLADSVSAVAGASWRRNGPVRGCVDGAVLREGRRAGYRLSSV